MASRSGSSRCARTGSRRSGSTHRPTPERPDPVGLTGMPGSGTLPQRIIAAAAAASASLLLGLIGAAPGQAAYPGKPGKIVFKGDTGPGIELFLVSPFGGDPRRLTFNDYSSTGDASWSRDGRRIVFRTRPDG